MKIKILIASFLLTTLNFAQNFHIGPELGMNLVQLNQEKIGNNYQPSGHAGLALEYDFTNWFSVKSGVFYTQKRQAYSSKDTSLSPLIGLIGIGDFEGIDLNTYTEIEGRHTQNYVQLPLMGSFKWEGVSLSVGGYVGYQFSSRTRENEINNTPFVSTLDIASMDPTGLISSFLPAPHVDTFSESSNNSSLRTFDFGIKGGIGYQMDNFGVNIWYLYGLPDYRNSQGNNVKQNHKYVQLSMNYMFGFGNTKVIDHSRFE